MTPAFHRDWGQDNISTTQFWFHTTAFSVARRVIPYPSHFTPHTLRAAWLRICVRRSCLTKRLHRRTYNALAARTAFPLLYRRTYATIYLFHCPSPTHTTTHTTTPPPRARCCAPPPHTPCYLPRDSPPTYPRVRSFPNPFLFLPLSLWRQTFPLLQRRRRQQRCAPCYYYIVQLVTWRRTNWAAIPIHLTHITCSNAWRRTFSGFGRLDARHARIT